MADLGRADGHALGKTAEQLIEIVGKDSEAATKLRALSELGEAGAKKVAEDAAAGLAKLGELVAKGDKTEIQRVVLTAYDQFGYVGTIKRAGGWKNLTAAIGKESSTAGDLVMRWRDGLLKDLQDFIAKETAEGGQVVRTGTATNVTNDMDMSMFGEMAAQNGEKAKQFLAGRAGIGVDELDHVLNAEIFVDPSRMHLQDVAKGLAADTRAALSKKAALYEEQMVFGRRLFEATDEEAKAAVRKEAEALGITPWEGYGRRRPRRSPPSTSRSTAGSRSSSRPPTRPRRRTWSTRSARTRVRSWPPAKAATPRAAACA